MSLVQGDRIPARDDGVENIWRAQPAGQQKIRTQRRKQRQRGRVDGDNAVAGVNDDHRLRQSVDKPRHDVSIAGRQRLGFGQRSHPGLSIAENGSGSFGLIRLLRTALYCARLY